MKKVKPILIIFIMIIMSFTVQKSEIKTEEIPMIAVIGSRCSYEI